MVWNISYCYPLYGEMIQYNQRFFWNGRFNPHRWVISLTRSHRFKHDWTFIECPSIRLLQHPVTIECHWKHESKSPNHVADLSFEISVPLKKAEEQLTIDDTHQLQGGFSRNFPFYRLQLLEISEAISYLIFFHVFRMGFFCCPSISPWYLMCTIHPFQWSSCVEVFEN